ncbi:MAG: sodium:calcium antiporter [Dehalococcoidia bacterium]
MAVAGVPALVLRLGGVHIGVEADTALFGLAIVSAAFLLAWAAEAAEVDVSQGVAVAFIALIAVLPEYAVDITFAWKAGQDPTFAPYAVANMTGGNRLLIGAAWPLVFLVLWWRTRARALVMERRYSVEIIALTAATLYSFTLPLKGSIAVYDAIVLGAIFLVYISVVARSPAEEPELVGPARTIGSLPRFQRRATLIAMFAYAALVVVAAAEPFAEGLIEVGTELGIDHFLLVQWVAPLASEAPEFLIAAILAWRGRAAVAMGALLSSKVNQWTLLVGSLPFAYSWSAGTLEGLPLDTRQQEEVLLTAAQSLFAVGVLVSLSMNRTEAIALFALFFIQFAIPIVEVRLTIAGIYVLLGLWIAWRERDAVRSRLRDVRTLIRNPAIDLEEHAALTPPRA